MSKTINNLSNGLRDITNDIIKTSEHELSTDNKTLIGAINEIEGYLGNTENVKYSTVNGEKEFTCEKSGYIDNMHIEGETLVNVMRKGNTWYTSTDAIPYSWLDSSINVEGSTLYTYFNYSIRIIKLELRDKNHTILWSKEIQPGEVGTVTSPSNSVYLTMVISKGHGWTLNASFFNEAIRSILFVKGDHSNRTLSYFDGLSSIGQGDMINAIIREANADDIKLEFNYYKALGSLTTGEITPNESTTNGATDFIYVGGGNVRLNRNGHFLLYDENFNFIRSIQNAGISTYNVDDAYYIRVWYALWDQELIIYKIAEKEKKQIPVTLRSMPNGVCDTIEKRGNNYIKVQRCVEEIIDETYTIKSVYTPKPNGVESTTHLRFEIELKQNVISLSSPIFSDRFNSIVDFEIDRENIMTCGGDPYNCVFLTLPKSKLSAASIEGLKTWLQSNPIKIVYELEHPQTIELANYNIQAYEGINNFILVSGLVQGECDFEVTSSRGNEIEVLKDKVSDLDERMTEVFQLGNNVKQGLVDALIANGVSVSTSNTFNELISIIESMDMLNSGQINDYINQINNLNAQINNLNTQINNLNTQINNLSAQVASSKRVASGVVTSSASKYQFIDKNGNGYSYYIMQVSGIPFKPSMILVMDRYNQTMDIVYNGGATLWNGKTLYAFYQAYQRSDTIWYSIEGNSQVFNGGFWFPAYYASTNFTWYAYE